MIAGSEARKQIILRAIPIALRYVRMSRAFPEPLRGALLDLDGTLTDTEPMHFRSTNVVLAAYGFVMTEREYAPCIGISEQAFWERWVAHYGIDEPWQAMAERRTAAFVDLARCEPVPKKPGVDALLDTLAARDVPVVIASSSPTAQIQASLVGAGLIERIAGVRSAHDDVPRSKPAPDVYEAAAACIGVRAESCIAVEDSPSGARAARDAGAYVAVVPEDAADAASFDDLADVVTTSLHGVIELIEANA